MSFQAFNAAFSQRTVVIDPATGLLTKDGRALILALFNRTGAGTGIVPVVNSVKTPQTPLTAAGTTQGTALGLTADYNNVATVPAGAGVVMPPMSPGNDISVWNSSGNALLVYPFSGAAIGNRAVNAPYTLAAGALSYWQCWSTTQLLTILNGINPLL